jgi:exodeoxyribonuclease VII large subunit
MTGQLTLLELNNSIRNALQDAFPETIWVVAEISELKENRTGHCYLELIEKDDLTDEIKARARATIWSYSWRMIKPYFETTTGQPFTHGIKILAQVSVEFHPSFGLSLNIKDIDPTYTIGDLVRRRREIVRQLVEAGVMQMNKELELPLVPQRIAVISSATAAGYQDFVNQLENNPNGFYFRYTLYEAFMQGNEAVPSILNALNQIFEQEEQFDAVVIIRGGGATADLSCFDNFDLAYAVAQFPLPVITGIGHEKDDTIVDLVAHTRLKTPTAVAEFFISGAARFYDLILEKERFLVQIVTQLLDEEQERIDELADKFTDATSKYIHETRYKLQKKGQRLQQGVTRFTFNRHEELHHIRYRLSKKTTRFWQSRKDSLQRLSMQIRYSTILKVEKSGMAIKRKSAEFPKTIRLWLDKNQKKILNNSEKLRLLDPQNILQRGFTISSQNGVILKSATQVSDKSDMETRFADGTVLSKIIKNESYGNK